LLYITSCPGKEETGLGTVSFF